MKKIASEKAQSFLEDISTVDLRYVADGGVDVFGAEREGGNLLVCAKIIFQNDIINLYFDFMKDKDDVDLCANDLRELAKKLNEWADISDASNFVKVDKIHL